MISVPRCVCCGDRLEQPGSPFCPECSGKYEENKARNCSLCARPLYECSCTTEYLQTHFVKRLYKVFRYRQREENRASNSLIYSLKQDKRADVLSLCADELSATLQSVENPVDLIITNVPRRRRAILEYGMDHSAILAREVAKRLGARYISILRSDSKRAQKSLHGADRLSNADFSIRHTVDLAGATVIIVDDIVTTGASMSASAMLLRGLGAKKIYGAALAVASRDRQTRN